MIEKLNRLPLWLWIFIAALVLLSLSGFRWPTRASDPRAYSGGMSTDERTVSDGESTAPCHKETYTASDIQMVTWWYCDARGSYRKAYTFYNGTLHDTFVP
jgi:hypothetical protein